MSRINGTPSSRYQGGVILEKKSPAGASVCDFLLPAGFVNFTLRGFNISGATDDGNLAVRFSTDAGSSFISTANYYCFQRNKYFGSAVAETESAEVGVGMTRTNGTGGANTGLTSSANYKANFEFCLRDPLNAATYKGFTYQLNGWRAVGLDRYGSIGEGSLNSTTAAINAVRVALFDQGGFATPRNFDAGEIYLIGQRAIA